MTDEYINRDIAWHYFKRAQCVKDRKELVDLFNQIPSINIQKLLKEKATTHTDDPHPNISLSNEFLEYPKQFRGKGE